MSIYVWACLKIRNPRNLEMINFRKSLDFWASNFGNVLRLSNMNVISSIVFAPWQLTQILRTTSIKNTICKTCLGKFYKWPYKTGLWNADTEPSFSDVYNEEVHRKM